MRKQSKILANDGFVFVSLILVVNSVFLPEIILVKNFMLGNHQDILTNVIILAL